MTKKTFLESDDQFIVSYELLHILQWLLTYEKEAFSQLVEQAYIKGSQSMQSNSEVYEQIEESEDLQNSVLDFFNFLEKEVSIVAHAESIKHIMQKNLLKTLDHIDPKVFDAAIIQESMQVTAEKINPQRNHQAKDYFLKQLLKKWHPKKEKNKKHSLN
ncbi:hypothetical protein [Candidatus Chromulinivorax destructor]|uniref:Uncharacterized protein n=1 Tax=Candidatus Chromulinivorax destructor TaxID=2066483 RepID=A0A345ZAG0_9BACT|nr:hypothetical protein [Candidatus Chromulinivorax destructor]AXK60277.1 hypothetical protein C0J27_00730 [Candidatus Chromulinivorax destructor]